VLAQLALVPRCRPSPLPMPAVAATATVTSNRRPRWAAAAMTTVLLGGQILVLWYLLV
jgi:hypothetical protein